MHEHQRPRRRDAVGSGPASGPAPEPVDVLRVGLERFIAEEPGGRTTHGNGGGGDGDGGSNDGGGGTRVDVTGLRRITGGMSREAWSFDVSIGSGPARPCILMRSAAAGVLDTDRVREFHLLASLRGGGVPVPEALWLDPDGRWLDRPAFVMSRMPGSADRRALGLDSAAAAAIDDQLLDTLVTLHAFPVDRLDLGPGRAGTPTAALPDRRSVALEQLARWETALPEEDLDRQPALVEILAWLRDRAPVAERLALVHGDYRYGNFLHDGHRITAILDWEEAHVGDPVEDVPWTFRPFRRGTEPLRSYRRWVADYERASGTSIDRTTLAWYRVLGELKCAAIYLTGLRSFRTVGGHDLSLAIPGQLIPCDLRQAWLWIDELELNRC